MLGIQGSGGTWEAAARASANGKARTATTRATRWRWTALRGPATNDEEQEPLIPMLKPDDSLIVEIDFHLPPRPQPTVPAGLQALQTPNTMSPQAAMAAGIPQGGVQAGQGAMPRQLQSSAPPDMSDEDAARLKALIKLIRAGNPYQLSHDGVLFLPGFQGIALAGLIEDLATPAPEGRARPERSRCAGGPACR